MQVSCGRSKLSYPPRDVFLRTGDAIHLLSAREHGLTEIHSNDRAAGPAFGQALEHYVLMELVAFRSYRERDVPIRYWRTKSGLEVDFVLGREAEVAIEVKGTSRVRPEDMKGIRAFREEHGPRWAIVVSNDPAPRRTGDIDVLPWRVFLDRLWGNELI